MIGGISRKASEEEFLFWAKHDVDFIQLGVPFDFFLDDKNISKVIELKTRFGLNLLVHPQPDSQTLLSPANPGAHEIIFKSLEVIRKLIKEHNLIKKIILHLSTYHIHEGNYASFTEEVAIANSIPFYEKLNDFKDMTFVFENVYPPGIGWEELGYEIEHFRFFDLRENYEFCLDTGHLNLSTLKIEDILKLPFELTCLHLQGNDGKADLHQPLTKTNFSQWKDVEKLLSDDKYIILEVKNDLEKIPHVLRYLKENKIAP